MQRPLFLVVINYFKLFQFVHFMWSNIVWAQYIYFIHKKNYGVELVYSGNYVEYDYSIQKPISLSILIIRVNSSK